MSDSEHITYQQAIQLKIYEGQLVWSRSQTLLVVNTILLAAIGVFLNSEGSPNIFVIKILSLLGIVICIVWYVTGRKGFAWNKFWSYMARDLEKDDKFNLLTRGDVFKAGEKIEFSFHEYKKKKKFTYSRPFSGRLFSSELGTYILIAIFSIIYFGLFYLTLMGNMDLVRV